MLADEFIKAVEAGIVERFEREKSAAPTAESRLLLERMCALIKRGGKRARPELFAMTYAAYGGKDLGRLVDIGTALEFHHQFLLVHDDIIDKDTVRYNGPNIVGFYLKDTQPDVSEAIGLIAGDLLFTFSNQAIIDSPGITEKQKVALLQLLNSANVKVAYGQQLDVFNLDPTAQTFSENLLRLHALKSSSYSAQLPMDCAAILLSLSAAERRKIAAFAKPFGILFQLVDDYSDYFVNKSAFNNRPKHRDFRQGKVTYPLHSALSLASPREAAFIRKHFSNKNLPDVTMHKVITILERSGAQELSRKHLEGFFRQALNSLDKLSIAPEYRQQFIQTIGNYRV